MIISPTLARRLEQMSSASDRLWILGMAIGLVLTLVAAFAPLPPTGGTMRAYLGLLARSALYASAGETFCVDAGATPSPASSAWASSPACSN